MTTIERWKHRFNILQRMSLKASYKILGKWNTSLQPLEIFNIKPGYHHSSRAESFDATGSTDEFQRSVYELACSYAGRFANPSILDVGCGSGYKLVHMLGKFNTIGIEVEPTYSWLLQKYPERKWLLYDPAGESNLQSDIVICSDVVEHFENPDSLMDFLQRVDFNYLILSTPERDLVAGVKDYGPPTNPAHYREWNRQEFYSYASKWFIIHEHHVFDDKSITQVVVCSKK